MPPDVSKLVDELGLDEAHRARLDNIIGKSGGFKQMLTELLAVKTDVDSRKETVMEFLAAAETFLDDAAAFARSQEVDEDQLEAVLGASTAERGRRSQGVFAQAREFRRLGLDVAGERDGEGRTQFEAEEETAGFERGYRENIARRMLDRAESQFGSGQEAEKVIAYFDESARRPLFEAVASGNAAQIQSAIRSATDTIVQKMRSETDAEKRVTESNPLVLRLRIDQLCSLLCIGAVRVQARASDLALHEDMLKVIMKRVPDEVLMTQIGEDYCKLAELGQGIGVKVRLSNGQTVRFYLERGVEDEIPEAVSTACDPAEPQSARVVDVDFIPDADMVAAIGQMSTREVLQTKLVSPVEGVGKAGDEIVIRGAPGTTAACVVESVGGEMLEETRQHAVETAVLVQPMKYLDRGFKIR